MKINSLQINFHGLKSTTKRSQLRKLVDYERPKIVNSLKLIYKLTKIWRITVEGLGERALVV